jgi:uncharacterized protein YciI
MKRTILIFMIFMGYNAMAQEEEGNPPSEIVKYYFVELITNPNKPVLPKAEIDSIQWAHMANIGRMIKDGKLMLAGPFEEGGGIFIFNVPTIEEAKALAAQDPAISAGRLLIEIRPWYTAKGVFTVEGKNED